jgi:hypothetical protein
MCPDSDILNIFGIDVEEGAIYRDFIGVPSMLKRIDGIPWIHYLSAEKTLWIPLHPASQREIELIVRRIVIEKSIPTAEEMKREDKETERKRR